MMRPEKATRSEAPVRREVDESKIVVRSYSDKAYRGNVGGGQIELPPGDYTVTDLRLISEVYQSVAIRMMERRGTLMYHPGHE